MKSSLRRSLDYVFYGGIAQSAVDTFATGSLITAYALLLGANNIAIGILGAVPYIGNLMHILASYILEKGYSVKKLSLITSFLSRPFYLFAALLAFFAGESWTVPALILFLTTVYSIGNIAGGAWRPWMKELVPDSIMGRFFAHRFKYMMIAKVVCFLIAYLILKASAVYLPEREIYVYSGLLIVTFFLSIYGACTFIPVNDVKLSLQPDKTFIQKISFCLKSSAFVRLMSALGSLNFAVNFITPFLTVFMLKQLNLSMSGVVILTLFSQIIYTTIVKKLGRFADKKGPHLMLYTSLPAFVISIIGFMILNALNLSVVLLWIGLITVHIFLGIGTAGIALGTNNLSLLYVPKKASSVYLAVNGTVIAFMGAIGSIIGGIAMTFLEKTTNTISHPNMAWYYLFGITIFLFIPVVLQFKTLKKID